MLCTLSSKIYLFLIIISFIFIHITSCFKIRNNFTNRNYKLFNNGKNLVCSSNFFPTDNLNISNETIYGLSSAIPEGGCGVAVVRVSGPDSLNVLNILTRKNDSRNVYKPREAKLCKIYSLLDGNVIDNVLTLYFKSPNSYTGDHVVEFHTHGSKAVVSELFENFRQIANLHNIRLRQAEKGEFTRRAFYSGKFNLTQVEGIRELISSDNYIKKKNSILKINNYLYNLYNKWTNDLIEIIGRVEGSLDFQEESCSDIILKDSNSVRNMVSKLLIDIESYLNNKKETIIDGIKLLLIGPPNSGKSSFINNLFNEDISIVSNIPGTTRDLIKTNYKLNHLNFQIIDTTGLRNISSNTSNDNERIELIGINKVLKELKNTNILFFLFDPFNINDSLYSLEQLFSNIISQKESKINTIPNVNNRDFFDKLLYICISKRDIIKDSNKFEDIINKYLQNIAENNKDDTNIIKFIERIKIFKICNLDQTSVNNIMTNANEDIKRFYNLNNNSVFINDQRHKSHLNNIIRFLKLTISLIENNKFELEIISEYLKECIYEIEFITGERTDDYVLNNIFNTFCVGK